MATGRRNIEWLAGRWPQKQRRQWRLAAATQSGLLVVGLSIWTSTMCCGCTGGSLTWGRGVVDLGRGPCRLGVTSGGCGLDPLVCACVYSPHLHVCPIARCACSVFARA